MGLLVYQKENRIITKKCTVHEAYCELLNLNETASEACRQFFNRSIEESIKKIRKEVPYDFSWDCEKLRTIEGYYRVREGVHYSIARAIAYAEYADVIWMETSKPNYKQAKYFANSVATLGFFKDSSGPHCFGMTSSFTLVCNGLIGLQSLSLLSG